MRPSLASRYQLGANCGSPPGVLLEAGPHWGLQVVAQVSGRMCSGGGQEEEEEASRHLGRSPRETSWGQGASQGSASSSGLVSLPGHDRRELDSGGSWQDTIGPVIAGEPGPPATPQPPGGPTPLMHSFVHSFLQLETPHTGPQTRGSLGGLWGTERMLPARGTHRLASGNRRLCLGVSPSEYSCIFINAFWGGIKD